MNPIGSKESALERYLTKKVGKLGGETFKVHRKDWPDRLVVLPAASGDVAVCGLLELKRRGAVPRAAQLYVLEQLRARGIPADWAATRKAVDVFVGGLRVLAAVS